MFDNFDGNKELLPIYPSSIQGELRIILQVKDEFLLCYKHLEALRILWDQQTRIITKEFIIEQIRNGESEIEQLNGELSVQKDLLRIHERRNDVLIIELKNHGETMISGSSKRRIKGCKTSLFSSCNKHLNDISYIGKDSAFLSIMENIAGRIDSTQIELKQNLRPLLEFYKDLFYLQLHFSLALTQISCYCMPLMTDTISLMDRLFFWTERPEFGLLKKSGPICDRLRDIYTRLQRILGRLLDSVKYLQDRIELQRMLEIKFYEKVRELNQKKENLLEEIHATRLYFDLYEEENDRLVGTLAKIDPNFVKREAFSNYSLSRISIPHTSADFVKSGNVNTKRKNKVKLVGNSESLSTDVLTSINNANDTMNVSNVHQILAQASNSLTDPSTKTVNVWRENAYKLLSKMHKSLSKNDSNIFEFDSLNSISEPGELLNTVTSHKSNKYMYHVNRDLTDPSEPNQTTDALVLTSDILPKDD